MPSCAALIYRKDRIQMIIYKSDVAGSNVTYTIDGDWISIEDENGIIKFHIPMKDRKPLYLNLFGFPGEPVRDEIDRLFEAVSYMRRRPMNMPEKDYEDAIAKILGMKYGRYQEKKRKGEIQYIMKRNL